MDWSFYYEGPKDAVPDLRCVTCLAGAQKQCPTHGTNFNAELSKDCAHCACAQGEPCHGHWGLEAALADHRPRVSEEAVDDFDLIAKIVREEAAESVKPRIMVRMRGDGHLKDTGHREIHLEIAAR